MGAALARAAIDLNHQVVIVSGPVMVQYPAQAEVVSVVSTQQMLAAALEHFPDCDGVIGAAAPCDYQPVEVASHKRQKTGNEWTIRLIETPDILAELTKLKRTDQWSVGFALETENGPQRAFEKLKRKELDLIVLNGATAIDSSENQVTIIDAKGSVVNQVAGSKPRVAAEILAEIENRLVSR